MTDNRIADRAKADYSRQEGAYRAGVTLEEFNELIRLGILT
jgi:hypothetical protein